MVKPFDEYTWVCVAAAASAVIATLALIDYCFALRKNRSTGGILTNSIGIQKVIISYVCCLTKGLTNFSGVSIITAILFMEPIEHKHLLKEPRSKARDNLILKWLFLGTLLALMYRSVLLATLVSVDYEKQIDTVEDLIVTEKPILTARGSIQLHFSIFFDKSLAEI